VVQEPDALTPGPESAEPTWVRGADQKYKLEWAYRNDAHKLVENFMLLANQQVAKALASSALTNFFRHQAQPSVVKWGVLREWAALQGHALPETPSRASVSELAKLLPEATHLSGQMQIRSAMSAATYDEEDSSHFSLGYETYTHFTSPIRRYADLVVHRLLMGESLDSTELAQLAQHCSARSKGAKFAERYVWDKIKKRTLVAEVPPGEVLQAYVVSQSRFGVRAVVMPWQCIVNVAATSLTEQGRTFDDTEQVWRAPKSGPLLQGDFIAVTRFNLEEFRSRTEVTAAIAGNPVMLSVTLVPEKRTLRKNAAQALGILAPSKR
jgi:ribonuclease R